MLQPQDKLHHNLSDSFSTDQGLCLGDQTISTQCPPEKMRNARNMLPVSIEQPKKWWFSGHRFCFPKVCLFPYHSASPFPSQLYYHTLCEPDSRQELSTRLLMCFSLSPSTLILGGVSCCVANTLIWPSTSFFLLYSCGSAHSYLIHVLESKYILRVNQDKLLITKVNRSRRCGYHFVNQAIKRFGRKQPSDRTWCPSINQKSWSHSCKH